MKAGILLYVLVVSLVLGLFLQFYLENQVKTHQQFLMEKDHLTAELMVDLLDKQTLKDKGTVKFDNGFVSYTVLTASSEESNQKETAKFDIHLQDGTEIRLERVFDQLVKR